MRLLPLVTSIVAFCAGCILTSLSRLLHDCHRADYLGSKHIAAMRMTNVAHAGIVADANAISNNAKMLENTYRSSTHNVLSLEKDTRMFLRGRWLHRVVDT